MTSKYLLIQTDTLTGADGHISYTAHLPGFSVTAYHSYNPHGDTTLLTSTTGEEWLDYTYDAFGNPLGENTLASGYTGKWQREKDSATGMIRMGVREYDPALGRFTSVDPLKGNSSSPQSRNRYAYALNNPLTVYDLDGRQAEAAAAGGAVIVITIPVSSPVIAVGGVVGGVGLGGGLIAIELREQRDRVQPQIYEGNRCIVPAPWNHPDAFNHIPPGWEGGYSPGLETTPGGMVMRSSGVINYSKVRNVTPELARQLGIPYEKLKRAVHKIKRQGLKGSDNVVIDNKNGDVYSEKTGEWIGNVYQED